MKTSEKQKLHQSQPAELTKKLRELEQKYMKTKLTTRAGKEKNLRAGFVIRQEIAIIKTIMGQKSSI